MSNAKTVKVSDSDAGKEPGDLKTAVSQPKKAGSARSVKKTEGRGDTWMYLGPGIKGVVREREVFRGDPGDPLKEHMEKIPAIKALMVPVSRAGETMKEMQRKKGNAVTVYKAVEQELLKMRGGIDK